MSNATLDSVLTLCLCGMDKVVRVGRWVEVLHNMVSRAGQKMLPSAVPSQSLMLGSQHNSAKKDRIEATSSAVKPLLSGSGEKEKKRHFTCDLQ